MGTYATTTSLQTLMLGANFDTATTSLATKCITHAEREIDKYLSRRYDLSEATFQTSTSVPPMVTMWAEQLSMGYMYRQLSRGGKEGLARGKALIDEVKLNLLDVAEFKLHVVDSAGSQLAEGASSAFTIYCNTSDYTPTFAEDDELDWEVDPDKLDDIASDRT